MFNIPVYKPSLLGNEKKYVDECINSSWISSKGKFIDLFEEAFSGKIGIKHAACVSNGTVALHLALISLGVGIGDEVIVPTLTYVASVNSIIYTGATPVFVDSLPDTWQMNPVDIERRITSKTKAILAVHLYGHPCDIWAIQKIAHDHRLFLIEDCAEAIGSRYNDQHVGTFGDVATFSFYGNKTITTGEGGMVVSNNETIFDRVKHFKGQGLSKYREYWHDVIGYNYRMTNICAAIGLAQLERIEAILQRKRKIAECYKDRLSKFDIIMHQETDRRNTHSYWMISILVSHADQRDLLREYLSFQGIETRPVFYPIHTMPMYIQPCFSYPIAENIGRRGINLPSYPDLKEEEIDYICSKIISFVTRKENDKYYI